MPNFGSLAGLEVAEMFRLGGFQVATVSNLATLPTSKDAVSQANYSIPFQLNATVISLSSLKEANQQLGIYLM